MKELHSSMSMSFACDVVFLELILARREICCHHARMIHLRFAGLFLFMLLGFLCACDTSQQQGEPVRFYLPPGDVEAGQTAFNENGCAVCHTLPGDQALREWPTIALGPQHAKWSRSDLAQAIITPGHRPQGASADEFRDDANRMGDYGHALTVGQLIDIVAYVQTLDE